MVTLGVLGFCILGVDVGEGLLIFNRLLVVWCSRALYTWGQLVGGPLWGSLHWVCLFLNRFYWFGVVGLCTLGLNWGSPSVLGMCLFINRFYWFGVVGLCTLGVDWWGRAFSFLNRLYWFGVVGLCTLGHD